VRERKKIPRVIAWLSIPSGILTAILLFVVIPNTIPDFFAEPVNDTMRIIKSYSWPEVDAIIVGSSVIDSIYYGRFNSKTTKYAARVVYSYNVNGRKYSNWSQNFERNWHNNPRPASLESQKYKIDSKIKIKYDPDKPGWACFECKISTGYFLFFASFAVIGLSSLLLPTFFIWMLFQGDRFLT
jgi:Protein of unknown function (DUF3592)